VFNEPLPSNHRRDTNINMQTDGIYGGAVEMGTGIMIYSTYQVSYRSVQAFKIYWGGGGADKMEIIG
jgi:hypothetical protein